MGKSKELAELGQVVTQDGGNVGVGITPAERLTVDGNVFASTGDGGGFLLEGNSGIFRQGITAMGFNTNGAERMRIDASGRVTMTYQPCFMAYNPQGQHMPYGELKPSGVYVNTGGHYNTSTGRFTAPISGRYLFNFDGLYDPVGGTGDGHLSMRRNGVQIDGCEMVVHGAYHQISKTMILSLSAGDYVSVFIDDTATAIIHQRYGSFNGYLIG